MIKSMTLSKYPLWSWSEKECQDNNTVLRKPTMSANRYTNRFLITNLKINKISYLIKLLEFIICSINILRIENTFQNVKITWLILTKLMREVKLKKEEIPRKILNKKKSKRRKMLTKWVLRKEITKARFSSD